MNIDLEKFEEYQKFYKALAKSYANYNKALKESSTDKFGLGFNKDSRFSAGSTQLHLDSWLGYYGSSSCSWAIDFGGKSDLFYSLLTKYLNNHIDEILTWIISEAKSEMLKESDTALRKLNRVMLEIRSFQDEEN